MNAEQPGWTTDENGTRLFRHAGWEVKVWGPQWTWERMEVTSPWEDDVFISDDVLQIDRRLPKGSLDVQSFVVPLPIVRAMLEAREMINEQHGNGKGDGR